LHAEAEIVGNCLVQLAGHQTVKRKTGLALIVAASCPTGA
jgi:hypothetical protein